MWTEEVREERDQFCVFCRDQAQTNWVKMFDKLHPIVLCLTPTLEVFFNIIYIINNDVLSNQSHKPKIVL